MAITVPTVGDPRTNRAMSTTLVAAMNRSAPIIVRRRSQRSTNRPHDGPSRPCGRMAATDAYARMAAEPVSTASHHTKAKLTAALPSSEKACPAKMTKKVRRQRLSGAGLGCVSRSAYTFSATTKCSAEPAPWVRLR